MLSLLTFMVEKVGNDTSFRISHLYLKPLLC